MASYIIRIFCTSVICVFALVLGGKKNELLRLACACVMIIAVLTFPDKISEIKTSLEEYTVQLENEINNAQTDLSSEMTEIASENLSEELERIALSSEIKCDVNIMLNKDFSVEKIKVRCAENDIREVSAIISSNLEIDQDMIDFEVVNANEI